MDNSVKDPQVAATLSKIRQMTEHTEALQQLWAALCISDELPHKRQFAIWLMDNDYSKRMAKDGNSGKLMANHGKSWQISFFSCHLACAPTLPATDLMRLSLASRISFCAPARLRLGLPDGLASWPWLGRPSLWSVSAVLNGVKFDQMSPEERGGRYRYHGVVLIRISRNEITYWREYQHISPLVWEEFVGVTKF